MSFAFDSTTPVSGRTIGMKDAERFWGFAHGAKCCYACAAVSMSNYRSQQGAAGENFRFFNQTS